MNEELRKLAERAGFSFVQMKSYLHLIESDGETLQAFARLIAEECAKEAEILDDLESDEGLGAKYAAAAIRARFK